MFQEYGILAIGSRHLRLKTDVEWQIRVGMFHALVLAGFCF